MTKPKTIDEYIRVAPPEAYEHLQALRALLRKVAPKATEAIKWGSPIFEEKRILFAFTAHRTHVNFMPTHRTLDHFKEELADYKTGKDTIQLPYDKPLLSALIRKLAMHRAKDVRENDARWM
jgi:uncharacterized protein YdhG (YjbR/CyaY superfamily)